MELKDFIPLPKLEDCKSLLCIQPHPDDNEVGAGATIARLAANGCKITYLTVTDGSMGTLDPAMEPQALAAIRKQETQTSASSLGVSEFAFLDFEDGSFPDEKALCESITSVIRKVQPEMVMTVDPFLPYETHPDHQRVGLAAARACLFSAFPRFHCGDQKTWAVKGIAFYSTAYPNTYMNVDSFWEQKMAAIALHKSQFDEKSLQMLGFYFDFKARQYAQGKGFERAEAFKLLTTDHLHMNVDTTLM